MHIYKTTNLINGKIYIGQEKHNKSSYKGSGVLLWKAIRKYGWDNFIKETIEECHSIEHMNEREKYWIKYYKSQDKAIGYNISDGGIFGTNIVHHPKRKEILAKRSKTQKANNKLLTKDEFGKIFDRSGSKNGRWVDGRSSNSKKHNCLKCNKLIVKENSYCTNCRDRTGKNNPNFGKKLSDEEKQKRLEKRLKTLNTYKSSFGVMIGYKVFKTLDEAINYCQLSKQTLLNRIRVQSNGYIKYNKLKTMNIEEQYLHVLKQLVHKAGQTKCKEDRTGTGTFSTFGVQLRHNMQLGFPLLTTKKVHFKSVLSELLWFLRGQTDLHTLLKDKNYIWVGDAYKKYTKHQEKENLDSLSKEEYIQKILDDEEFSDKFGQLGPIYGAQWRGYTNESNQKLVKYIENISPESKSILEVDQLHNVIEELRLNPDSRRLLVDSWNPEDLHLMTLPPCHMNFQFYTEKMSNQEKKRHQGFDRKISLHFYMRSWDIFLGAPFNIASYALLLEIVAKMMGYLSNELIVTSGDTHIYSNHIDAAKLQISREPFYLPKLQLSSDIIFDGTINDLLVSITEPDVQIQLDGYFSHSKIQAELSN